MKLCRPGPALICLLGGGGTGPHILPRIRRSARRRSARRRRLRSFHGRIVVPVGLKSPLGPLFFQFLHRGLRDCAPSFFLPLLHALGMSGGRQQGDHDRCHCVLFHNRPPCCSAPRSRPIGGLVNLRSISSRVDLQRPSSADDIII